MLPLPPISGSPTVQPLHIRLMWFVYLNWARITSTLWWCTWLWLWLCTYSQHDSDSGRAANLNRNPKPILTTLGPKNNISGINPAKRSRSGPNSVYVDMSRG